MRISDGSSDVCSSDLDPGLLAHDAEDAVRVGDEAGALIGLRDEIGELRGQEILADGKAGLIIVGDDRRQREQVVDARVGDPHGPQHAPDVGDGIALRMAGVGADAVQELDRKRVVSGKSGSVRVDHGGRRILEINQIRQKYDNYMHYNMKPTHKKKKQK